MDVGTSAEKLLSVIVHMCAPAFCLAGGGGVGGFALMG